MKDLTLSICVSTNAANNIPTNIANSVSEFAVGLLYQCPLFSISDDVMPTKPVRNVADIKILSRLCLKCGDSDIGDLKTNRPCDLLVTYSQHRCGKCSRYFNADLSNLADHHCQYTRRVVQLAIRHVVEDGRKGTFRLSRNMR